MFPILPGGGGQSKFVSLFWSKTSKDFWGGGREKSLRAIMGPQTKTFFWRAFIISLRHNPDIMWKQIT